MVYNSRVRRHSLVVKPQLPKLMLRVRFPLPAPKRERRVLCTLLSLFGIKYTESEPHRGTHRVTRLHLRRIPERSAQSVRANMVLIPVAHRLGVANQNQLFCNGRFVNRPYNRNQKRPNKKRATKVAPTKSINQISDTDTLRSRAFRRCSPACSGVPHPRSSLLRSFANAWWH